MSTARYTPPDCSPVSSTSTCCTSCRNASTIQTETDDVLRLGLHRLPIAEFPRLRSLAGILATYDGAAELDEGLDIVIAGLRSQLLTPDPPALVR